jgi:hypothetical protein
MLKYKTNKSNVFNGHTYVTLLKILQNANLEMKNNNAFKLGLCVAKQKNPS